MTRPVPSARDRLAVVLAPDVLAALEEFIAETVRAELAAQGATNGSNGEAFAALEEDPGEPVIW